MNTKRISKGKFRGRPTFDFVSPRSLTDCADLLKLQSGRTILSPLSGYRLAVDLNTIDVDTYQFCLQWENYSYGVNKQLSTKYVQVRRSYSVNKLFSIKHVEMHGYLKRWEGSSTYVTGFVKTTGHSILMMSVWYAILFALTLTIPSALIRIAVGLAYVFTLLNYLWLLRRLRNQLISTVKSYLYVAEPITTQHQDA